MNEVATKELCLNLMKADTEEEVIDLLSNAELWENGDAWRCLGDNENNYSVIGSQQSRSDAALVEKLVNSVDARLIDECLRAGVNPESNGAPPNIRYAVAKLIEKSPNPENENVGRVGNWTSAERTRFARQITLAATGSRSRPSFTIADAGEGQTPDCVPDTLMSLTKSNKLKIPFVQGKFNMGGTGALRFCGKKGLQLVVTRRDPSILHFVDVNPSNEQWGFTLVRRDYPTGNERSSVYRYLAPLGSDTAPGKGGILRFSANSLPIFPDKDEAYSRDSEWGTLVKLYEYQARGYPSHILRRDGLLYKVDLLLPDPALPIRFHECRGYGGGPASFDTTLTGLGVRLSDDKGSNMEDGFPTSCPLSVEGQKLVATIYAFKKGKAETYRKKEGVIFVLNGQTHAAIDTNFFRLKKVGLSYIANSLLVKIDCSGLNLNTREDLFMNSRDRLNNDSDMKKGIVDALAQMLKEHDGLRELKNRRREEEISDKLADNKPLAETLESILKQSPTLSSLFLTGAKLSNAFKTKSVKSEPKKFKGEKFPTYFRFKGKEYGKVLERDCHINLKCRLAFETDAENEYFSRDDSPGTVDLKVEKGGQVISLPNYVGPYPNNGLAALTFELPDGIQVGDILSVAVSITDESRVDPFENICRVSVQAASNTKSRKGKKGKPPSEKEGDDRDIPSGIALPNIIPVKEEDWPKQDPPFDKSTALIIRSSGEQSEEESGEKPADVYDFFINEDNFYLKAELKSATGNEKLVKSQFTYGMVLTGLALLHHHEKTTSKREGDGSSLNGENIASVEDHVEEVSKALAPFMVPMIEALGAIEITDDYVEGDSDQAA